MEVVTKAGVCVRSMYLDYDDEAVHQAKRYLFERARDDDDEPFMLAVSLIQPHDPYLCRQDEWNLYRHDDIDLPSVPLGAEPETPHDARLRYAYGASDVDVDDDTMRNARHAYYGSVTDIDNKVADLLQSLSESGFSDDTIVIFTSDHGDMLGERGMWFKMSYREHSARVPMIVHAPKMFSPHRVSEAVSLVDLMPTLVELCRDGKAREYATPIEGRSMLSHLNGSGGHDEEYFAEGVDRPMFMVKRGVKKLIWCASDPTQYFDTGSDPMESTNLAEHDEHTSTVDELISEIKANHDLESLRERVIESQNRRAFLKEVMKTQGVSWDYQPPANASNAYVRNTMPIYQLEKRARFPQV